MSAPMPADIAVNRVPSVSAPMPADIAVNRVPTRPMPQRVLDHLVALTRDPESAELKRLEANAVRRPMDCGGVP